MKIISTLFAASTLVLLAANGALAAGKPVIGVSWSNFQEERWKTDEAAIKAAIEKAGGTYISADAQSSPGKQLTDIESLITKGANALIVLAQDSDAIRPARSRVRSSVPASCSARSAAWSFASMPVFWPELSSTEA